MDDTLHRLVSQGTWPLTGDTAGALAYLAENHPPAEQLNKLDGDGRTVLQWAATSDDRLELVRTLLDVSGINVDSTDTAGWTPLMTAASAGAGRVVAALLAQCVLANSGANPAIGNVRHITPLHYAASKGRSDIAAQLLSAGADVNALDGAKQRPMYVATDSHRAATAGHDAVIRVLLSPPARADGSAHAATRVKCVGANSPADRLGNTPLHLAIESGHGETAALLIGEAHVDRDRANADGQRPEELEGIGGLEQRRMLDMLHSRFGPLS